MKKKGAMKYLTVALLGFSLSYYNSYAENIPDQSTANSRNTQMQPTEIKNKKTGEAFLSSNKIKPGVVSLPDGLQYKVLTEGKGPIPKDNDLVTVHYSGTLVDGTEFDSSYQRGEPTTFPVNGVIRGWTEALKMMKTGSTWMLYIPPTLAYGEQGAPPAIGANETLIFKVELLGIVK